MVDSIAQEFETFDAAAHYYSEALGFCDWVNYFWKRPLGSHRERVTNARPSVVGDDLPRGKHPRRIRVAEVWVDIANELPNVFAPIYAVADELTYCFSKKLANLEAAFAMFAAYYNYCWRTRKPGKSGKCRPTAAVMAGLADHTWSFDELFEAVLA